jgi:hypothetical protein
MRWWTESVAAIGDVVPLAWLVVALLLGSGLTAAAWYWYPAWVPRRWPRWRLSRPAWRLRRPSRHARRRRAVAPVELSETLDTQELPDLPATAFASLADRLAAQGRYAEAVRERLRAMVRELIDAHVIEHRPGWTIGELAGAAARARPATDPPLRAAGGLFSDLWYGQRPAAPEHDARMRQLAEELRRALSTAGTRGAR